MIAGMGEPRLRHRQLASLISSIGGNTFDTEFLRFLNELFLVDLHTAFIFDHNSNLVGITGASRRRKNLVQTLNEKFYSRHWRGDLALLGINNDRPSRRQQHWRMRWTDIPSEQMRKELYRDIGIMEKLSIWNKASSGFVIWNVYRQDDFFSKDEFNRLRDCAETLSAVLEKHLDIVKMPSPREEFGDEASLLRASVERRGIRLSCRELSVCQGIIDGATSKAIAAHLGLKVTSVITYKKRIYEKLGVSTHRELLRTLLNDSLLLKNADCRMRSASCAKSDKRDVA